MMRISPPPTKTGVTLVVAASNSKHTERADYVCDGTADEVEINAAIDALPATGGVVKLLDGTFTISAAITIDVDNTAIIGCGKATKITIPNSTSNINIIDVSNRSYILIKDLYIDGNSANQAEVSQRGIYIYKTDYSRVEGCWVFNVFTQGIYLNNVLTKHNVIIGNFCYNNDDGIILWEAIENTITGNVCVDTTYGIYCAGNENTITGNICYDNDLQGIYLYLATNNSVVGNICQRNGRNGIYVFNSSHENVISGNICKDNDYGSTTSYDGIQINNNSSDNIVTGNRCRNNDRDEIRVDDDTCERNLVSNNICTGTDHVDTIVDNGTDSQVFNNIET